MEVFEVILKGAPYFLIGCITILTYYSYKECQLNSEKKDIANIANIENLSDNEKALRQLQEVALAEYKKECLAESESRMREYEEIKKEKEAFALAEAKDLAEAKALAEVKAKSLAEVKEKALAEAKVLAELKAKAFAEKKALEESHILAQDLAEYKKKLLTEKKALEEALVEKKALEEALVEKKALEEIKYKALEKSLADNLAEKKALAEAEIQYKALEEALAKKKALEEALAQVDNKSLAEIKVLEKSLAKNLVELKAKAKALAQVDNKSLKSVLEVDYFNFDFHLILEYLKLCLKYLIPGLYIGILGYLIYIFYKKIKFVYNCWKTKTLKITFLNWLFDPEILFVTSKLGMFYWICMFVLLGILYNISGLGYWFTFLFCGRVFIWNWIKFGIYKLKRKNKK